MKKHECKHYYNEVMQQAGFYWLLCECGYKMQLIGIQKREQAEEQRVLNNKNVKK